MLSNRAGRSSTTLTQATEGGSMFAKSMLAKFIVPTTDTSPRSPLAAACILLLPCAAVAQTPQPPASPNAITMQQAVDLARAKNPTLLAAQQNLLSVKAQEIQAGVRANPYFTLNGTNISLPAEGASNPYAY